LVGGDEAKIYGSPEAAGRCMAEYEHHAVLLRGSDGALPRQDQTAAASTASKKRRDRRRKKQATAEQDKETREAQAAQGTNLARSEDDDDDDEADSEHRAIATPSGSQLWSEDEGDEDDRSCAYVDEPVHIPWISQEEAQGMVNTLGVPTRGASAQRADEGLAAVARWLADDQDSEDTKEEGEPGDEEQEAEEKSGEGKGQAGPTTTTAESGGGDDDCSFSSPLDDRASAKWERSVEEEGESISLEQQPEAVEEGAGAARVAGSMGVEESGLFIYDRVHHTFCFSQPSEKRGRKLSGENQQEEAKRPKSPEKEDEQQAGQAEKSAWSGAGGY